MLPLFGAIGFGISFALMGAITRTIYDMAGNFFIPGTAGIEVGVFRGIVVGLMGGIGLGLAQTDKKRVSYFPLAGVIGFGFAFALVVSINNVSKIGWAIIELMRRPIAYDPRLASSLGIGIIVGAIGGSVLG